MVDIYGKISSALKNVQDQVDRIGPLLSKMSADNFNAKVSNFLNKIKSEATGMISEVNNTFTWLNNSSLKDEDIVKTLEEMINTANAEKQRAGALLGTIPDLPKDLGNLKINNASNDITQVFTQLTNVKNTIGNPTTAETLKSMSAAILKAIQHIKSQHLIHAVKSITQLQQMDKNLSTLLSGWNKKTNLTSKKVNQIAHQINIVAEKIGKAIDDFQDNYNTINAFIDHHVITISANTVSNYINGVKQTASEIANILVSINDAKTTIAAESNHVEYFKGLLGKNYKTWKDAKGKYYSEASKLKQLQNTLNTYEHQKETIIDNYNKTLSVKNSLIAQKNSLSNELVENYAALRELKKEKAAADAAKAAAAKAAVSKNSGIQKAATKKASAKTVAAKTTTSTTSSKTVGTSSYVAPSSYNGKAVTGSYKFTK